MYSLVCSLSREREDTKNVSHQEKKTKRRSTTSVKKTDRRYAASVSEGSERKSQDFLFVSNSPRILSLGNKMQCVIITTVYTDTREPFAIFVQKRRMRHTQQHPKTMTQTLDKKRGTKKWEREAGLP
jgi:hypothetical protein